MKCDEEKLLLYAADELDAAGKAEVRAHLNSCSKCQASLRFITASQEALNAPAAPAALVDAVFAKTTRRKKAFRLFGWKPLLTGAAALGIGLLCLATLHPTDKNLLSGDDFIAYMSENLDEEYQSFSSDLALFEEDF